MLILRWWMKASLLTATLLLAPVGSRAQRDGKLPTLAVLDFENTSRKTGMDWVGTGIAETLTTDLSRVRQVRLVERKRLHDVLKELKFGRSAFVSRESAQQIGKIIGADHMVVGSFQLFEQDVRLTGRVVEVATGRILAPTRVDGKLAELMKLQTDLAENLTREIGTAFGTSSKEKFDAPTTNVEAHRFFSDGAYYYRNDLHKEALESLDAALAIDARYALAHFYKGLTLQRLGRWEDSVRSFKQALLGAGGEAREKWSWQVPWEKPGSKRGVRQVLDSSQFLNRSAGEQEEFKLLPDARHVVFLEVVGKTTVLHIVDAQRHTSKRLVLPDPDVLDLGPLGVVGASKYALFHAYKPGLGMLGQMVIYGVDVEEGALAWRQEAEGVVFPFATRVTNTMAYTNLLLGEALLAFDLATGQRRWVVDSPLLYRDPQVLTVFHDVPEVGDILVLWSAKTKRVTVIRGKTGQELWASAGDAQNWSVQRADNVLVALDPSRRTVAGYRLTTGEPLFELSLPVQDRAMREGLPFTFKFVPSDVARGIVYLLGRDQTVYAVDAREKAPVAGRLLWKSVIPDKVSLVGSFSGLVTVLSENGMMRQLNARTGKIEQQGKFGNSPPAPVYMRYGELVVLTGSRKLFGMDWETAQLKWEYPTPREMTLANWIQGMVVFQSGKNEITALDATSGQPLWRHVVEKAPVVLPGKDSVFVADVKGISEYISPRPAEANTLAKSEVFTQIGVSLLEMGQSQEAASYLQRVLRDLDPDYAEAHLVQARIHQKRGESDSALRRLLTYYILQPSNSPQALELLNDLKKNYQLLWQVGIPAPRAISPTQDGKALLVAGENGSFEARDAANGQVMWRQKFDVSSLPMFGSGVASSVLVPDAGRIYVTARGEGETGALQIWEVDVSTGQKKMMAALDLPAVPESGGLFYSEATLYLRTATGQASAAGSVWHLRKLDSDAGKVVWEHSRQLGSGGGNPPVASVPGHLAYLHDNTIHFLSAADGRMAAEYAGKGNICDFGRSLLPGAARVLICEDGRRVVAFDVGSRRVAWTQQLPPDDYTLFISPRMMSGSTFYFRTGQKVLALDVSDKPAQPDRIVWSYQVPEGVRLTNIFLAGDKLYAAGDDSRLIRLDAETGKVNGEFSLLWDVDWMFVRGDIFYGVSNYGYSYAMKLVPRANPTP